MFSALVLLHLLGLGVKLILVHASVVYTVLLAARDTNLHLQPDLGERKSHRTASHRITQEGRKRKGTRDKTGVGDTDGGGEATCGTITSDCGPITSHQSNVTNQMLADLPTDRVTRR